MNPWRVCNERGEKMDAWACGKCGMICSIKYAAVAIGDRTLTPDERLEYAKATAERCCNHKCKLCGDKAWSDWQTLCRKHFDEQSAATAMLKEQERFDKAEKLTTLPADYHGVLCSGDDYYFDGFEEAIQSIRDNDDQPPEYFWLAKERRLSDLDISAIVGDHIADNMHEDAADGIAGSQWLELHSMFKTWADSTGIKSYCPDFSRCILVSPAEQSQA